MAFGYLPVLHASNPHTVQRLFAEFKGELEPCDPLIHDHIAMVAWDKEDLEDHNLGPAGVWLTPSVHEAYHTLMRFHDFGGLKHLVIVSEGPLTPYYVARMKSEAYGKLVPLTLDFVSAPFTEIAEGDSDDTENECRRMLFCRHVAELLNPFNPLEVFGGPVGPKRDYPPRHTDLQMMGRKPVARHLQR